MAYDLLNFELRPRLSRRKLVPWTASTLPIDLQLNGG